MSVRIRLRGPSGARSITLPGTSTWQEVISSITTTTGVQDFALKYGYPPQDLIITDKTTTLSDLKANGTDLNGEQLTLVVRTEPAPAPASTQSAIPPAQTAPLSLTRKPPPSDQDPPTIPVPNLSGTLTLLVMPDDNSCLFRALGTAVLSSTLDSTAGPATELRSIVASTISDDTTGFYTKAVLDNKEPAQYARWIQRPDSWGGAIEIKILSEYFGVEVDCISVQDGRVDRFNAVDPTNTGDGVARRRVILVYSGIHYDVVALSVTGLPDAESRKVFEVVKIGEQDDQDEDGGVLDAARELCKVLRDRHYYTDTAAFAISCGTCGWTGNGEKAATRHAETTGHTDFGEA